LEPVRMPERRAGRAGEERAARFLESLGYQILQRNFRTRRGEIDIVAQNGDRVAFVEVKSWNRFGPDQLGRSIDARKRGRIRSTSRAYLLRHPELQERRVGYDVILCSPGADAPRHYENAFDGV
jgi:putative endonuclease